jgi:two-component system cell cycle response regulator CtrA
MLLLQIGKTSLGIEDEAKLLREPGVNCKHCDTASEAFASMKLCNYDIVLIALELPDMPGYEAIRMARAAGHSTPIIVLASAAPWRVKVRVLDQGADDFIITPCGSDELLARMRAVVRRSQVHSRTAPRIGPVELNLDRHEVRVDGIELQVSRREFETLELLFLKQGTVLSKSAFLKHLYADTEIIDMKTIDIIICRLRKRLAVAGVCGLIQTVWGQGYTASDPPPFIESTRVISLAQHRMAA